MASLLMHIPKGVCRLFVTDDFCHREARGQCHLIHDWDMLYEYIEKKKQAALQAEKPTSNITQKPTTHPFGPGLSTPKKSAFVLKPKSPTISPQTSAPKITAKPPNFALQAAGPPFIPTTSAVIQTVPPTITQETLTAAMPSGATASPPSKGRFAGRQCRFYVNGRYCPFQNRQSGCFDIHNLEARKANLAKQNLAKGSGNQQQNNLNAIARLSKHLAPINRSRTVNSSDTTAQLLQKINDLTVTKTRNVKPQDASSADAAQASVPAPKKNWDTSTEWERWAARNLSGSTAAKFIAPYLPALANGTAPLRIFAVGLKPAATGPGAATTFHTFGLLPFELRDLIWEFAVASEKSECRITYHFELDRANRHIKNKFVPMNATPRFMHVNSQARAVALKVYEKAFGTDDHPGTCWFNFKVDRLFLNTSARSDKLDNEYFGIVKSMKIKDRKRVHFLAIPLRDLIRGDEKKIMEYIALGFKNLYHISLLAGDGEEDSQWTRDQAQQAKIKSWNKKLWLRVQPKRKLPPPSIKYSLLPAHTAHFYKIDGFKW